MDLAFKPRLDSSVKWTPLPQEFVGQIQEIFEENFQDSFAQNHFIVQGQVYPQEILLRIGHIAKSSIRQKNFEASIEYNQKTDDLKECIYIAVDLIASLMTDYLKIENLEEDSDKSFYFPLEWKEHRVEKKVIYLKSSSVNTELEAKADQLLGSYATEELVTEIDTATDALDHSFPDPELCH